MLRLDCFIAVDFQTTRPPRRGKVASIIKDCKKVLAHSPTVNHLHIVTVQ